MNKTILISGITGFLGSHAAQSLHYNGYLIIGLKRKQSDTWRCTSFEREVRFINVDEPGWKDAAITLQPSIIIHAAWSGVTASVRNDMSAQLSNLYLTNELLEIAVAAKTTRFIGLGSQAEYGELHEIVEESQEPNPVSAYAIAKLLAQTLVKNVCKVHGINWYWLRIFSVFGEKEEKNWLIPSVSLKIASKEKQIELTACDQKYAYMYIEDFTRAINLIVTKTPAPVAGIYNLSGRDAIPLKKILETIKAFAPDSQTELSFGKLAGRGNQSTHLEGNMDRFFNNIGAIEYRDLNKALEYTFDYYRNHFINS